MFTQTLYLEYWSLFCFSQYPSFRVPLERGSSEGFRQREARAARLASEIEASAQYRHRVALENDEGRSEEDKYSAVVRDGDRERGRDSPGFSSSGSRSVWHFISVFGSWWMCFVFVFIYVFFLHCWSCLGRANTFPYHKERESEKLVHPEVTEKEADPPPHFLIEQTDLPPQARPPGRLSPLVVVSPLHLLIGTVRCQSEVDILPTKHSVAHLLNPGP